ncbi:inositol 2-dehydrogenase [Terricaulis silvestris]|uniref:Inositol 2-dehydrogenase n=1 Tax=Terricaulis silvestris TaxID=2686094 RepID=A0A6I6MK91_9CAUL|nr:inositol 2-dehydrogenase [Terricaulis silvestris]QGZ93536.1 Inositol 2-dehydrogenase [Terricaulis silvestris]
MHKIALIGAGRIGRIHAANVAAHPDLQLAYVVDPIADAAKSAAASFGAKTADLDGALGDASVDGVIVASSTDTHLDFSLRAAQAGKAIFCEKPIDLDLARAEDAASKFEGARLFLAFNRRFDPNFRALKKKLDAGAVGKLETLHITSHDPSPPPAGYIPISGGLFKDMAIHDFDMARWILGEEPSEVFAAGACLIDPEIGRLGDIDTAKTILRTPSGKLCVISNSRRSGYGYDQRIEAFGSEGALRAGNVVESTVEAWTESGAQADQFQNFFLDRYATAYHLEMAHFADIMARGAMAQIGYSDGVGALKLATAAQQSLKSGAPVSL